MKTEIIKLLEDYKKRYPGELSKLSDLDNFLETNEEIFDWNNFNGHITVGVIVYNKKLDSFLLLKHKELNMYLYPGGHVEKCDNSLIDSALRELKEETNISKYENMTDVIDIDIHDIEENKNKKLPSHKHFDFRFLIVIDKTKIVFDEDELNSYKWVSRSEFKNLTYLGDITSKIDKLLYLVN